MTQLNHRSLNHLQHTDSKHFPTGSEKTKNALKMRFPGLANNMVEAVLMTLLLLLSLWQSEQVYPKRQDD